MQEQNTRTLQLMLHAIAAATNEIPDVIPDGIFGPQTERSVRAFQQAADLPPTGKVDDATWQSILLAYERLAPLTEEPAPIRILLRKNETLSRGSRNKNVLLVQAMLRALGSPIPSVTVTGIYDAPTEAAVRAFQQLSGLPANGQVDLATWNALAASYRLINL